jgi:hypothetical protein
MIKAIDDYDIVGVKTTLPFCKYAIDHKFSGLEILILGLLICILMKILKSFR